MQTWVNVNRVASDCRGSWGLVAPRGKQRRNSLTEVMVRLQGDVAAPEECENGNIDKIPVNFRILYFCNANNYNTIKNESAVPDSLKLV